MIQQRPIIFPILSLAYLGIALSLPIQIMVIYEHPISELSAVLAKMTVLNWAVFVGSLITSYMLYVAEPFTRAMVPFMVGVVTVNNFFVGYVAADFPPDVALWATVGFALLNTPLLLAGPREVLVNPRSRWWTNAKRKRAELPIAVGGPWRNPIRARTFDLSESGVFVSFADKDDWKNLDFQPKDPVQLSWKINSSERIQCFGRVVRVAEAKGNYPTGMGIEFVNISGAERRRLRRYLEQTVDA